jgi:hypothetical protein
MTASPWAPSNAGGAVAPHITTPTAPHAGPGGPPSAAPPPPYVPAPPPPRGAGPRLWPIIAAFSVLVVAAIAITAVITAAIVKTSSRPAAAPPAPPAPTAPAAPQYSAAEQGSAKQSVCQAFDAGERGNAGQGGVVIEGKLNVPIVLRMVNSVVAVQNALTPATPTDVSDAAHEYLTTNTDLTTAALANKPVDELIDLTKTSNNAIDSFADVCGLPH